MDTQQPGPRGGDKLYSTNWFMASAEHRVGAQGSVRGRPDAEPRAGHHHRPALSVAFPNRRDRLRRSAGGRAAPAQFHHGPGIPLHARDSPKTPSSICISRPWATPRSGRWRFRTARPRWSCRRRRSRITGRIPPISPTRCSRSASRIGKVKLEASGFHGAEPGENRWIDASTAPSTRGPRDFGTFPRRVGPRRFRWHGSPIRKRSNPATRRA